MRSIAFAALLLSACTVGGRPADEPPWQEEDPPDRPLPDPVPAWGVPITGGTMTVTRDGLRAIVADPDRDRVVIVDLVQKSVAATIPLDAGSEPGRVVEDVDGRIHVALRGSGQLLTITGDTHVLRPICGEPRGLAAQAGVVHVACATGELVSVPAAGGDPIRTVRIERDLRDVIVRASGTLAVTTFRTAELLELDAQGAITRRIQSPIVHRVELPQGGDILFAIGDVHEAVAEVAWRTIALPDGRIVMSHQRRILRALAMEQGGYGGQCDSVVQSALTVINTDGTTVAVEPATDGALPVDIAVDPKTGDLAVIGASINMVYRVEPDALDVHDDDECDFSTAGMPIGEPGAPTAVAFMPGGTLLAFVPERDAIVVHGATAQTQTQQLITLGAGARVDLGRELFHRQTGSGLTCASCHPEGRDDGAVWSFGEMGVRRTQNLAGGIQSRGPYHWTADMETLPKLLDDVFAMRMGGGEVKPEAAVQVGPWLDRVRAPRGVITDAAAVVRGEALFDAPEQGCRSCHAGALLTNNLPVNVGTNGILKVPSLIGVGGRAPYMHDGCAATLRDRFGPCGGGDKHGFTSHLTPAQIDDLVAYLESL